MTPGSRSPSAGRWPALVIATSNPGKQREIREILDGTDIDLQPLDALPPVAMPEEGDDYTRNAEAKAAAVARALGRPALADDSGLEVDALGGKPGPRSARYGGPGLDDAGRVARLLSELAGLAPERRGARFVCVAVLAMPGGELFASRGQCPGRILEAPRGDGGFGFDPVFEVADSGRSMAELPAAEKNRISHRARAVRGLRQALWEQLGARARACAPDPGRRR